MSGPGTAPWWRELLRAALRSDPRAAGPHITDDEELIACWAGGLLPGNEVLDHLAECDSCRREVLRLVADGLLELPQEQRAVIRPRRLRWRGPAALAFAATLLLAVGAYLWLHDRAPPRDPVLAAAKADLDERRYGDAVTRLETWLDGEHPAADREQAKALLERAGYETAREELTGGRPSQADAVVEKLKRRGVASARLCNLALQAAQRQPVEVALVRHGSLLGYGYEMDGSSPGKALPVIDDASERTDRDFRAALRDYPNDAVLHINYGQFLLAQARTQEARDQFTAALKVDPDRAEAHLGLGLAAYELNEDDTALAEFESFLRQRPNDPDGYVNAAVTLERMGQAAKAVPRWQKAADLTADATLRQRIATHLKRLGAPAPENP